MTASRRSTQLSVWATAAAVVLVACLSLAVPAGVAAHAQLVASSPSDGEEVSTPPDAITLVFSEAPEPGSVSVRLFDRREREIELAAPELDSELATTVTVAVSADLRPGPYTVVWSVVSEEDEHPASREFVFGVAEPAADPSVTAAELAGDATGNAGLVARFLMLVGLVLLVGAAVQARWFGLPTVRMAYLAAAGAAVVFGSLILDMLVTAGRERGARSSSLIDAELIAGMALVGLAFYAPLVAASRGRPRSRLLWLLALLAAVGLVWLAAANSHAAGVGILLWVGYVWDAIGLAIRQPSLYGAFPVLFELARHLNTAVAAVHTLAIAAWIGGLVAAGVAGLTPDKTIEWHPRFSRFALIAFLVVAATGLYQAVLYLPSAGAVLGTEYGLMLLGKHVFVAGVLALAALHRFIVGPALRRGEGLLRRRVVGVVRLEAVLGVAVVGAAVLLATTPPARPPTDVFYAPSVMNEFTERRQVITGSRPGWELVVLRQSSNRHEFRLRMPDEGGGARELVLEGPGADTQRRLPLERVDEAMVAQGLVLTRDGHWTASVSLSPSQAEFDFEVRAGHVVPYHAHARALWDGAIEETEARVRSARMVDVLTDGLSVMLFAHHDLVAPDRQRLEILGRHETIRIGRQRFSRDAGGEWQTSDLGSAFDWPDFAYLERAMGIRSAGTAIHAGEEVTVLAGYDPEGGIGYEMWVGDQDNLIHRLVMGLPGHYMVNAYYQINEPISVKPPVAR